MFVYYDTTHGGNFFGGTCGLDMYVILIINSIKCINIPDTEVFFLIAVQPKKGGSEDIGIISDI